MSKVSIIIPSRNEKPENLTRTIASIYENATGDFEIIVGFNGKPFIELPNFKNNLRLFGVEENIGLKPMINRLAKMATGKYIYKSDAHCAFSKSFDEELASKMKDNWIVTPRFYVLDGKTWQWQDDRFYDYFYLSCPFTDRKGLRFKAGGHWPERTKERANYIGKGGASSSITPYGIIDETPQIHGSGWFVSKDYFLHELGGFPETDPFGHAQEPIWLGLKNWLMGGKVMVNKRAWYAHLHQDSKDRGYPEDRAHTEKTYNDTAKYWLKREGFEAFVDKFMPMPTWKSNWKEVLNKWRQENI